MKKILFTAIPLIAVSLLVSGCSSEVTPPKPTPTATSTDGIIMPTSQKLASLNGSTNTIEKDRILAILDADEIATWTVSLSDNSVVSFEPQILSYGYYAKPAFMGKKSGITEVTMTDEENSKTYKFTIIVN